MDQFVDHGLMIVEDTEAWYEMTTKMIDYIADSSIKKKSQIIINELVEGNIPKLIGEPDQFNKLKQKIEMLKN